MYVPSVGFTNANSGWVCLYPNLRYMRLWLMNWSIASRVYIRYCFCGVFHLLMYISCHNWSCRELGGILPSCFSFSLSNWAYSPVALSNCRFLTFAFSNICDFIAASSSCCLWQKFLDFLLSKNNVQTTNALNYHISRSIMETGQRPEEPEWRLFWSQTDQ